MKGLKKVRKSVARAALIGFFALYPALAGAVTMADFSAFPAFLPRTVAPNILFLLDYSSAMVRPAYGACNDKILGDCRNKFIHLTDDYDPTLPYYGYFDNGWSDYDPKPAATYSDSLSSKYECASGGKCEKASAGSWNGNWLNWLVMTQFDIVKKVSVGGHFYPAPEGATTPNDLKSVINLSPAPKMIKVLDSDTCASGRMDASWCTSTHLQTPQVLPFSWVALPGSGEDAIFGTAAGDSGDMDSTTLVTRSRFLPFTTTVNGFNYSEIHIENTGRIELSDSGNTNNLNVIPFNHTYNDGTTTYKFRIDLTGSDKTHIKTFVTGTAPNRAYVVNYYRMMSMADTGKDDPYTFQVLLYETGDIVFQYRAIPAKANSTPFGGAEYAYMRVWDDDGTFDKNYSSLTSGKTIANGTALFMTPKEMLWEMKVSSSPTVFTPAVPLAVTTGSNKNDFGVNIDIKNTNRASLNVPCPTTHPFFLKFTEKPLNCTDHNTTGLFHLFRDLADEGTLGFRLGFMKLGVEDSGTNGAKIASSEGVYFNANITASMMNNFRGGDPTAKTPLAEGLYEAMQYFRQSAPKWSGDFSNDDGDASATSCEPQGGGLTPSDPYCYLDARQKVDCCKSYVLLVSSGEYSHDFNTNIYGDANPGEDDEPPEDGCKSTIDGGDCDSGTEDTKEMGGWLDDVAYQAHVTDLRPTDLLGMQNLTLYTVNTFGGHSTIGGEVLKRAARFGGFKDTIVKDNAYTEGEEDLSPVDGVPDTYFEASGGSSLKDRIMDAVLDILKSSSSGTSVSVLSAKSGGEGAIYQAYFYPARQEGVADERSWPGFMRSFFVDKYRNMRDDYSNIADTGPGTPDDALVLDEDRVARMYLDVAENTVKVKMYRDDDGKDVNFADTAVKEILSIDDVQSIWEAGNLLAKRNKSSRIIYTWLDDVTDTDNINKPDTTSKGDFSLLDTANYSGELYRFTDANWEVLAPYLRAGMNTDGTFGTSTTIEHEAEDIIDFVRGEYVDGYRNRCIAIDEDPAVQKETNSGDRRKDCEEDHQRVWTLGDIVFSTPTLVAAPAERYDAIYGSTSYQTFRKHYQNRRNMIYVGGNDGMLHAFNSGILHNGSKPNSGKTESAWLEPNPATDSGWTTPADAILGQELWAFVPPDVLPHLVWTACNGSNNDPSACGDAKYTHTYYVDHRPKVTDAQIFPGGDADPDHPGGWGTILIMGMRQGGGAIDVDLNRNYLTTDAGEDSFRSAYYAFDITNPEKKPRLLWRFTDPNLGFTTGYPAIVRVADPPNERTDRTKIKWYMVVGSGPQNTPDLRDYASKATNTQGGRIFVVDLKTGEEVRTFSSTDPAGSPLPAANTIMGDVSSVDADLNFSVDVLYVGSTISQTTGKVFRINTNQALLPADWDISLLIDAGRPVQKAPSVSMDVNDKLWVYFGTGRLENKTDASNYDQQYLYGVRDKCWSTLTNTAVCDKTTAPHNYDRAADLFDASGIVVSEANGAVLADGADYGSMEADAAAKTGWFLELNTDGTAPSERVLARGGVLGGYVFFTAYTPGADVCSIFGTGTLYALNYVTGTAGRKPVLGKASDGSFITAEALDAGIPSEPVITVNRVFVQSSTGRVIEVPILEGTNETSGTSSWREKSEGTDGVEIEEIYKHMIKND